jgi:hypothetical protein
MEVSQCEAMEDTSLAQQPPQQPSELPDQDQPNIGSTSAQRYKYGRIVLAIISVIYFSAWWFSFVGVLGSVVIFNIATRVVIVLGLAMFALDWQGYTTLLGLITWQRLSGGKKFWLVCAFVFVPEFMVGIYLVRAIQQHLAAAQLRPSEYAQSLWRNLRQQSAKVQGLIGGVTVAAVIAFCTLSGVAANGGHPVSQDTSFGSPSVATNQPSSNGQPQKPTATNTPSGPTATPAPSYAHFGDGTFQVGKDIQPGTYRTRVGSMGCYYARLKGFGGTLDDIISNNLTDAPAVVTIAATDKGFESHRCGTWTRNLSQITKSKTTFGEGLYIVGTDIAPGTYKNTGSEGCYYARLSGFGGGLDNIIANNNVDAVTIVTIAASDKGFESHRCGTWTKQ